MIKQELDPKRRNKLELVLDRARWRTLSVGGGLLFYGQLAMGLKDVLDCRVPTACTDGRVIKWNPDFLEKLTDQEILFVLIHETCHLAWGHLWRFGDQFEDPKLRQRANIACDHAINLKLLNAVGFDGIKLDISMPEKGYADSQYEGMAEEEIYLKLSDNPNGDGSGNSFGDFEEPDEKADNNGEEPEDGRERNGESLKDAWTRRLIQAAQVSQGLRGGLLPAELERVLQERLCQKIDFRQEMVDFVRNCISEKNDWTRSSKRWAHYPVIIPRKKKDAVSRVLWIRDTSGSVDCEILSAFNVLIEQCIAEMGCTGIVMDCDAAVHARYEVGPGIAVSKTAKGGGGTSFVEPFEIAKKLIEDGDEIAGLIYLTDLAGDHITLLNPAFPDFPVLWLSVTKDLQAPFGRTVFVDIN